VRPNWQERPEDETMLGWRMAVAMKKVVEVVGVSACPVCDNGAFDLEPGADIDDPHALVRCGKCGHICPADQFVKAVRESEGAKGGECPGS
jgi:hypothetical protein